MARVLIGNFKGPKGDKGDQGATGPRGEQGIQGEVGPAGGVNSVNGGQGDVVIGGRNLWTVKRQTFNSYVKFDSSTGIYTMSDADTNTILRIKLQQYYKTVDNLKRDVRVVIDGNKVFSITTDIADGADTIRIANDGKEREFSVTQPIPSTLKAGDTITLSFEVLDATIGHIQIRNLTLVKGNVVIDWTPAPEDKADQSALEAALKRIEALEAKLGT